MKILVLSDSHSALRFMRYCVDQICPDVLIHLGDHYEDGRVLAEEYPGLPIYQVPGNCDRSLVLADAPEVLFTRIAGVPVFMTHGHRHHVKQTDFALLQDARRAGAKAVLYGHTHLARCSREEDGMWVLNPGSCGYYGGSAGLIVIENGEITHCRILRQQDLEEIT